MTREDLAEKASPPKLREERAGFEQASGLADADDAELGCVIPTANDKLRLNYADHHNPCPGPAAYVLCGRSATLDLGAHRARRT
jgi:hypothetical protein